MIQFHNYLSKEFEFLHPDCEFTDDTAMTIAVADALLDRIVHTAHQIELTGESVRKINAARKGK